MSNDEKRPLGKILLQRKLVSQQDLDSALKAQRRGAGDHGTPLASQLTETGVLEELDALRALSEQHGVPGIRARTVAILLEHLDVVPREVSETHRILPLLVARRSHLPRDGRSAGEARRRRARVRHGQEGLSVHRAVHDDRAHHRRGLRREG